MTANPFQELADFSLKIYEEERDRNLSPDRLRCPLGVRQKHITEREMELRRLRTAGLAAGRKTGHSQLEVERRVVALCELCAKLVSWERDAPGLTAEQIAQRERSGCWVGDPATTYLIGLLNQIKEPWDQVKDLAAAYDGDRLSSHTQEVGSFIHKPVENVEQCQTWLSEAETVVQGLDDRNEELNEPTNTHNSSVLRQIADRLRELANKCAWEDADLCNWLGQKDRFEKYEVLGNIRRLRSALKAKKLGQGTVQSGQPSPTPPPPVTEHDRGSKDETLHGKGPPKQKRSTQKGEAQVKLISALTKHHGYADGGCINLEPIGNNALARLAQVDRSTASAFFTKEFKGHQKYKVLCNRLSDLVNALKLLNGEFSPHILYGARPSGEDDRDR